tara:strand:+ start:119 stop:544 length:426 start_codon:yes stop_codon:yes gene_type:complete
MANYDASSTNKSKKSVRTYTDLDLDFSRHPVTNDIVKIEDINAVKRSVRNLINTQFYERPFHPELGCGVRDMLFENFTPMTGIFMRRKIEEVLSNYEPRASITSINVNEQQDRNGIDIVVSFYVLNSLEPVSITTSLRRIR